MQRLKELREEKNISRYELADAIQTSRTNIGRWERGENDPSSAQIIKLAEFFGCSADFLLGREDDFGIMTASAADSPRLNDEQKLLAIYRGCDKDKQRQILDFAEYCAKK